ncbi:2-hydroxyacid dehydrogenase family protein [Liquorilactobacillus uvarum]|uniref:Glyoxylate reductase n=1 Tax=Liquorilactobacillus uvarum DSM 19971 TaxID=1423812 RepID=A0A0R1PX30_9LACO|nr:2-hydroxyacid dehydrogenase family protein [Liquorilactobacillus uvarum]KRL37078.1 glyoxylate reductase [Liquorilactobacillus uvarum DSM 19971]
MEKVLITGEVPEHAQKMLESAGLNVDVFTGEKLIEKATLMERSQDASFLITPLSTKVDAEVIDHAPKLKLIANFGAGFNNIDTDYAKSKGIMVTNTPFVSTVSTAEVTVGLIISLTHRIPEGDHLMRTTGFNGWAPLFFLGHELSNKVLGIIGMGQIGQAVAERMKAFGVHILYTQHHRLSLQRENELGAEYVEMDKLIESSDIISLHLPLSDKTHHMISANEFKHMKKNAILINAARGPIIDEDALLSALLNHEIAGAALDVYENEPVVADGFKKLKNVVLTPHIGNATFEARNAMAEIVASNVVASLQNKEPKYIVNGVQTRA